jgi:hypothetical protein
LNQNLSYFASRMFNLPKNPDGTYKCIANQIVNAKDPRYTTLIFTDDSTMDVLTSDLNLDAMLSVLNMPCTLQTATTGLTTQINNLKTQVQTLLPPQTANNGTPQPAVNQPCCENKFLGLKDTDLLKVMGGATLGGTVTLMVAHKKKLKAASKTLATSLGFFAGGVITAAILKFLQPATP